MSEIIDGKNLAKEIRESLKVEANKLKEEDRIKKWMLRSVLQVSVNTSYYSSK